MGAPDIVKRRVVFDTTVIVSALLFPNGRLAWLRQHWQEGGCETLLSRETALELTRVLRYPKFKLTGDDYEELLADYLPFCEAVEVTRQCRQRCRDTKDQMLLDLAESSEADFLITGDRDLLELAGRTRFLIAPPEAYLRVVREG